MEEIWQIRHAVMYPAETTDFVRLADDETGLHWGLYKRGELVSIISLFERGNTLQFRKFATIENKQGKGYGTVLLQHVMDWAVSHNKTSIWCNARSTATAMYKKFGMQQTGAGWENYGLTFIKMEKQL